MRLTDSWQLLVGPDRAKTPAPSLVSRGANAENPDSHSTSPDINHDGSVVVFESEATNMLAEPTDAHDVFVAEGSGLSVLSPDCSFPAAGASLSADGRFIAFCQRSSNPNVPEADQVFLDQ